MARYCPKISIIIPAYNCKDYIADTLQSCLSQDYDNFEVIVVNDGSTDSTCDVIAPFLSDPRVMLANQENKGVSAARNLGIELAKGDYITFLDSDDTLAPSTFRENVEILQDYPEVAWLYFPIQRIDGNGNAVDEISPDLLPSYKFGKVERMTAGNAFVSMSRRLLPTCACGAFYRRDFMDLRFKSGRFEDTVMVMELLRKHRDIMVSPYGAYLYYDRPRSFINSGWDAAKWTSYVNVLVATMQTRLELFPLQRRSVDREKTRLFYTLRYLKLKNAHDESFAEPLEHYLKIIDGVKPSLLGSARCLLKISVYRCLKFVTRQ